MQVVLLLLGTGMAAWGAWLLSRIAGARTWSDRIAQLIIFTFAILIFVSESAGKISYTPLALSFGVAAVLVAILAFYYWLGPAAASGQFRVIRMEVLRERSFWADPASWLLLGMFAGWLLLLLNGLYSSIVRAPFLADGLRYHLMGPALWIAEQKIGMVAGADYRVNHFPHAGSLLFGWPMVHLRNDLLSTLPNVIVATTLAPAVIASGAQRFGADWRLAWIIGFSASSAPPLLLAMRVEFVDALFWLTAAYAVLLAVDIRQSGWRNDLVIGCAMGIAFGTKTFGAVFFPMASVIWIVGQLRRRTWTYWATACFFGRGALMAGLALLVGGWVYFENVRVNGNPVFPYDLKVGPIQLAGAAEDELFRRKKVLEGQSTKIANLLAVVSLYPQLFLQRDPFEDPSKSLGDGFPMLLLLPVLLAIWRSRDDSCISGQGSLRLDVASVLLLIWGLLATNLVLAAHWGAQFIHKGAPDYGSAGRYQGILPILAVWVTAAIVSRRASSQRLLAVATLFLVYDLNLGQLHKPGTFAARDVLAGPGSFFEQQRLEFLSQSLLISPPEAYWRVVGTNEDVIVLGVGGLLFHFTKPGFTRRVFAGFDPNVLYPFATDREIYATLVDARGGQDALVDACGGGRRVSGAYADLLVERLGIEVVVLVTGAKFGLGLPPEHFRSSLGWSLVFDQRKSGIRFEGYRRTVAFRDTSKEVSECLRSRPSSASCNAGPGVAHLELCGVGR